CMLEIALRRTAGALRFCCLASFGAALLVPKAEAETNPEYYAVEASASAQVSPPQITSSWSADWNATGYAIARKANDAGGWSQIGTLSGRATNFIDNNVSVGVTYEYQLVKSTS